MSDPPQAEPAPCGKANAAADAATAYCLRSLHRWQHHRHNRSGLALCYS